MRNHTSLSIAVLSLLASAQSALGQCTSLYDASLGTLPSAQGWTAVDSGSMPAPSVVGGELLQGPTTTTGVQYWTVTRDVDFDKGASFVVDLNVIFSSRAISSGPNPVWTSETRGYGIIIRDRLRRSIALYIMSNDILLTNNEVHPNGAGSISTGFNSTAWHRYRVDISNGTARLFIDDPIPFFWDPIMSTAVGTPQAGTANTVSFGDLSNENASQTRLHSIGVNTLFVSSIPRYYSTCPHGTVSATNPFGADTPRTLRWQVESLPVGSDVWADVSDGTLILGGVPVGTISGATTNTFTYHNNTNDSLQFRTRLTVTNSCGTATGEPLNFATCRADFNCDGFTDYFDYADFANAFEFGGPGADFNNDGFVDGFDYDDYVSVFETGC